jgi:transcriptional regulator with XRE-family HTH domain
MPTFAERLRELRNKAGLTQEQLADKSGVPLGSIRQYEQALREPYWSVVFKLAAALGVSTDVFAGCVDGGNPAPKKPRGRKGAK